MRGVSLTFPSLFPPVGNDGKGFKLERVLIFVTMESMINPEYLLPKLSLVFTPPAFEGTCT